MSGRPIQTRDRRTYQRDIEHLMRLRTAIQLDNSLDVTQANRAIKDIDRLTQSVLELIKSLQISA